MQAPPTSCVIYGFFTTPSPQELHLRIEENKWGLQLVDCLITIGSNRVMRWQCPECAAEISCTSNHTTAILHTKQDALTSFKLMVRAISAKLSAPILPYYYSATHLIEHRLMGLNQTTLNTEQLSYLT